TRPNIVWVDLADLDFSEGSPQLKLDLISELAIEGGIAGNVGGKFADVGPMTFLSLSLLRELAKTKPEH
ncbi:MAG: choloylglycine hydrolase, partial [Actinobacteria bacterium]|nr:choloylglycine hydrolase [Actinomycetota bacterium]